MQNKVWQTIDEFNMCPEGIHIVVGISGGADSVVLLHVLKGFAKKRRLKLTAVHVHHGLRGKEADADKEFVEALCRLWEIPCKIYEFCVEQEAKKRGIGTEEAGRLLRYEVFEKERKGGLIAVAHNQNDQAETVLMRLCRGAGVAGLAGIRPIRECIIRPLLFCTRKEIEAYCEENNLSFRQDSTNFQDIYTRNRIRNQVLPLLEESYSRATEHIAQTAKILADEEAYLQEGAQRAFQEALKELKEERVCLDVTALLGMHKVIRRRIFDLSFSHLKCKRDIGSIHFDLLESLLYHESGKRFHLPNQIIAEKSYDTLVIKKENSQDGGFSYLLKEDEEILIAEADIFVRIWVDVEKKIENDADCCTKQFDYDKIDCDIFCRTRQKGDRLAIRNGRKKLKDFMIDEKILREERDALPLIAADSEILWVLGKRVSSAYLPNETTKRFLTVQIRRFV
ncbi:MAG: tRNA lysidine(34) synthetase TilS [Anaerotignum sp.]